MPELISKPAPSTRKYPKNVSTNLPDYLWEAVCKKASEERRSMSDTVRMILEDALEAPRGD